MARTLIRPGGRSERIQVAVHKAVKELISEIPAENVTIALIAARAEVPPSTIYRRWVTLDQLLLDVANQRFLPDAVPPDTGSFRGDLAVWIEQTVDDLSSAPMRALGQSQDFRGRRRLCLHEFSLSHRSLCVSR
ncbi:TetR/AcrR family transcriptional regulator [uncultured Agrobacterium sp.]|uniref:TetR/AcrR family transcriptional regulator n=1 Tax=uncultured Agrobacterium sp. TaxID=157277 RepID=UPI0025F83B83|nr:TetR/AcrR family transcriptional regulator [uncultured Agrobacterium sp.]